MRVTFLDSSYLLALIDEKNPHHPRARRWQRTALGDFLTTEYVLLHLIDALRSSALRGLASEITWLLRSDPGVGVVPASTMLMEEGLQLFEQETESEWSLSDCISFSVMRHAGVDDVLTTNPHFQEAGFHSLLRAEPWANQQVAPEVREQFCRAIRQRRVVQFEYHGGMRVVEPYRCGRGALGHELVFAYQRYGHSQSGETTGWKTFRLAEVAEVDVLNQVFAGSRLPHSSSQSRLSEVYCEI